MTLNSVTTAVANLFVLRSIDTEPDLECYWQLLNYKGDNGRYHAGKVTITNRKPLCLFLLLNTNYNPMSHRFKYIAHDGGTSI